MICFCIDERLLRRELRTRYQSSVYQFQELLNVQGFRKVVGCAARHEPLDLSRRGIGADNHHRNRARARILAQQSQYLVSPEVREVEIEKNQVGTVCLCQLEA